MQADDLILIILMDLLVPMLIFQVHSHVDVYNFRSNKWIDRFDTPKDMGHSHLGVATDGRYIYVVSGQYGPQCRGPTSRVFVLDTQTKKWKSLPPLPAPRFVICSGILERKYAKYLTVDMHFSLDLWNRMFEVLSV